MVLCQGGRIDKVGIQRNIHPPSPQNKIITMSLSSGKKKVLNRSIKIFAQLIKHLMR